MPTSLQHPQRVSDAACPLTTSAEHGQGEADNGASSSCILVPTSAERLADSLRQRKIKILVKEGVHWRQTARGFYEPLHWMARLRFPQVSAPSPLAWGLRASLDARDAGLANATLPLYVLPNLNEYDESNLSGNRRNQLRRCHKRVTIRQVTDMRDLREEGYEVLLSSITRTAHTGKPKSQNFKKELDVLAYDVSSGTRFVLAGWVQGKLGGYVTGYALNSVAYLDELVIATEAMSSYIGIGLQYEFIQACRRCRDITTLVHGQHSREDSSLHSFKESLGFEIQRIPTVVRLNRLARKYIHWRHKEKYYRLTGIA